MRLLVVGAGSTGGYFGGRLAAAGRDVTFLVRPRRAQQLRESGLRINSPHGNVILRPTLALGDKLRGPFDVVLLAVKSHQLEASLNDVARAVSPDTMILPVLNGMRHLDILATRFSPANVIGCTIKIGTTLDEDGRIIQLVPLQDMAFGELDGRRSDRVLALDAFLKSAPIGARLSDDVEREMWEKWLFLSAFAALTCLARGSVGEIAASIGGTALAEALVDEAAAIIRAVRSPVDPSVLLAAKEQLTASGSSFTSSMYRDILQNKPTEVDAVLGDLVRRGEAAGVRAPLLAAACIGPRVHERRLQEEAGA